jgi:hypothetical protein
MMVSPAELFNSVTYTSLRRLESKKKRASLRELLSMLNSKGFDTSADGLKVEYQSRDLESPGSSLGRNAPYIAGGRVILCFAG